MSYSETADSSLFDNAEIHDNEKSESNLQSEIKASHHITRNNPLGAVGGRRFRASLIGVGSQTIFDSEKFDKDFVDSYKDWKLYCDFNGQLNYAGIEALIALTILFEGSCFVVRRRTADYIPLRLQVVSPLSLATGLEKPGKGKYIRGGIQYSKSGRVLKYAFYKFPRDHPEFSEEKVTWVNEEDVHHFKDPLHPGQSLPSPWITPAASFASQYKDNQATETKSRLKRTGQQVFALQDDEGGARTGHPGKSGDQGRQTKLVHKAGGVTFLRGVKDIKHASPPELSGNYQEHNNQVLRMAAGVFGITYEMLTGDLTQVNYSSIRAGVINHRRLMEQLREIVLEPGYVKFDKWFIEAYQIRGATEFPGFFENPYPYLHNQRIWPEWEEIDPLKAAKALVLELQHFVTSEEEVAMSRGKTLDQQMDSIQRSQKAKEERGITSYAAIGNDDERTNDDDERGASEDN